ncbi:MAG: hypothetical protein HQK78_17690 [Desulfobacterales bacterium]|nr:hypothetical protein [Desulfobacterales bacterium]
MTDITTSMNFRLSVPDLYMTAKSHSNFDYIHLNSARIFSEHAYDIENNPKYIDDPQNAPEKIKVLYRSYVSSSIICSVSALEAFINQFLLDNNDKLKTSPCSVNKQIKLKFKEFGRTLSKKKELLGQLGNAPNALLKFEIIVFLLKHHFIPANSLKVNIDGLIKVRNALIHFKPEWDNAFDKFKEIESFISDKIIHNPFYSKTNNFFPYRCLSASCASWSVQNADEFIEQFKSMMA